MQTRPRILLIAEAANPEWPSVPLVGWSLSQAIARVTNAHLVTHVRNRDALRAAGLEEGRGKDFTAIDNEGVASPMWKIASAVRGGEGKGWTTLTAFSAFSYYSFESEVWRQFESQLRCRQFDLVHRITPLSPTHQSVIGRKLSKLKIPFVLGPLNGGLPWPKHFTDRQRAELEWLSYVRGLYKLMPYYRATRKYSSAIIVGSRHTQMEMPVWAQRKCVFVPENGVDPSRFNRRRSRRAELPLRAAFVGRLVPYKCADLLIEAASEFLRRGVLKLDIVGDGPDKGKLIDLAARLGISDRINFHGWVPHELVQNILSECDFFAFPSVREFGGGAVVEAMALGVAPVVANYGGPSELVDKETGCRVDFTGSESLVDGFRSAIERFVASPRILDDLGAAARERVQRSLTWDAKASQICHVYERVLDGIGDFSDVSFFSSIDR
jgi:glycosyltransferase involved in cell wall biosynthesis